MNNLSAQSARMKRTMLIRRTRVKKRMTMLLLRLLLLTSALASITMAKESSFLNTARMMEKTLLKNLNPTTKRAQNMVNSVMMSF